MSLRRASGVLLHPTSFPTRFGVGDLGPEAFRFVDWLFEARQQVWQVLPLGPPDSHGSPYTSVSSLAGKAAIRNKLITWSLGLVQWCSSNRRETFRDVG